MTYRTIAFALCSALVVGCADDEYIPVPQSSEPFGGEEESAPSESIPAVPEGLSYAILAGPNGENVFSMWRLGYQDTFEVNYCTPPQNGNDEWDCKGWEAWKIEGFDLSKYTRINRIRAWANMDGEDQYVTMQFEDAGEEWKQRRDCLVTLGQVDFGNCSEWVFERVGGM